MSTALTFPSPAGPVQPASVADALAHRSPAPHWTSDPALFATLPDRVRAEIRTLISVAPGGGLFGEVSRLVDQGQSVQAACIAVHKAAKPGGGWKRFRARYDLHQRSGDWVALVNRSRSGAAWCAPREALPAEFIKFCATRFGQFKRADGKRQALMSIKRQWATGLDTHGHRRPIPGYGFRAGQPEDMPGWSYSNVLAQVKRLGSFTPAVKALLHQGTAAARSFIPQARFDRNAGGADGGPLRFLERVEFDDVKCDFLVMDPASGQACDLWLLIARDLGTALLLGFGMRPARQRDDGKADHLKLKDMRQLCGWILERFGLPPYESTWKIEHGTATLPEGARLALRELLPHRINVSYSSMIGGASPDGYAQRGLGNSKGKASLESQNRLMHTMLADLAGQTGPLYTVRPMDLASRAKEAVKIWETAQQLPEHLRSQVGYPLLTVEQARQHLFRCFKLQNERTEHALQGFDQVAEWFDAERKLWRTDACPGEGVGTRSRMESPLERCGRLAAPYRAAWQSVGPDIIRAFYEHTVRSVVVKPSGLIEFRVDDRAVEFAPPTDGRALVPGTRALGYSHPDDPRFLHLSDGQGRMLGTWLRRDRTGDAESLKEAIRYSQAALRTVKETADQYASEERNRLAEMREANESLLAANSFIEVSPVNTTSQTPLTSSIARALTTGRATVRDAAEAEQDSKAQARAALRAAMGVS